MKTVALDRFRPFRSPRGMPRPGNGVISEGKAINTANLARDRAERPIINQVACQPFRSTRATLGRHPWSILETRQNANDSRRERKCDGVVQLGNSYAFALIFELIAVRRVPYHRALHARLSLEHRGDGRWWIVATVPGMSVRHKPQRLRLGEVKRLERGRRVTMAVYVLLRSPQLFDWLCERGFTLAPDDAPALKLERTRG